MPWNTLPQYGRVVVLWHSLERSERFQWWFWLSSVFPHLILILTVQYVTTWQPPHFWTKGGIKQCPLGLMLVLSPSWIRNAMLIIMIINHYYYYYWTVIDLIPKYIFLRWMQSCIDSQSHVPNTHLQSGICPQHTAGLLTIWMPLVWQ